MIDVSTNAPLKVERAINAGPSMRVSMPQLPAVRAALDRHPDIIYWTSESAISDNGGPFFLRVEFGRKEDADQLQAILDSAA
jgi:hypothetical protein